MFQKITIAVTMIAAGLLTLDSTFGQYPHQSGGGAEFGQIFDGGGCASGDCGSYQQEYYPGDEVWGDGGQQLSDVGCSSGDCVGGPYFDGAPLPRRFAGRDRRLTRRAIRADRYGGRGATYGRTGNEYGAPLIRGECGDCNWGPAYLSIFGGVSFIDNLDSRTTFDNGVPGTLGVSETGFSTLDGVAAGGAIGRYFYRQARFEFEYTYRDNGIGDMTDFTFSDILATPEINDTLLSSTVNDANGNIGSNSFVFNVLFDLRRRTVGCLNAYLGGGIGVLVVDGDAATATEQFSISDNSFAFQGIAGINFPLRDRLDLYSEYRYLGADSVRIERTDAAGVEESLGAFRFDTHNFVFGLRFLR